MSEQYIHPPTPPEEHHEKSDQPLTESAPVPPTTTYSNVDTPVAQRPLSEAERKQELRDEAARRIVTLSDPNTDAQTYTRTLFYSLIYWDQPVKSGIAFASVISILIASSYFSPLRFISGLWSLAIIGNLLFVHSTQQYKKFTNKPVANPHESRLKASQDGLVQKGAFDHWVNIGVDGINLAAQSVAKIILVEDTARSLSALGWGILVYFVSGLISAKWILGIATVLGFSLPKLYAEHKPLVDHHVAKANVIVQEQTSKAQALAQQHAAPYLDKATNLGQQYGLISKPKGE